MAERVAAIDVGTNSVLMSVAQSGPDGRLEALADHARVTRLGRGVDASGALQPEAIARTLAVLGEYAAEARAANARIVAVGTSALRDASNARDFLQPAHELLGAPVEIISGPREAELSFAGALYGLPFRAEDATVVDVGGGSTEIVRRGPNGLLAVSIDIGAVRLTERFHVGAPATDEQRAAVSAYAERALRASETAPRAPLIATAGTATSLAAVAYGITPFDPLRVHGSVLSTSALDAWITRLAKLDLDQRALVPGLGAERADVIVAGALVLRAICAIAGARELRVSCGGVRYGLLLEALTDVSVPIDSTRMRE